LKLFITTQPTLEEVLLQELVSLGYTGGEIALRGVNLDVPSFSDVYRLNLCLSTASRILLPLKNFVVRDDQDLYWKARDIDWSQYMSPNGTFWIHANVNHPQLRHSLYAAQVLKDAICDSFRESVGYRPSVSRENPDLSLNLYIDPKYGIISFDSSGDPLHQRGYRLEGGESPLSESLAAAILRMAGYQGTEVLLDPLAGSGTFLVEAALMATKTPPGWMRKWFGFFAHPEFNEEEWLKVKAKEMEGIKPLEKDKIFGIEKNKQQAQACLDNLQTAGFEKEITLVQGDFRDIEPTIPPSFVVANPPYGVRLGTEEDLIPLYREMGDFLKRKTAKPSIGAILTGSLTLSKEVGLKPKRRIPLKTGGLDARLLLFDLY
jgi:putative N6-adenine-specific DNA methylase